MTITDKILFVLAESYNKGRITTENLNNIIKPKEISYITTYLNRMKIRNLVHIDEKGIKLTKWGKDEARKVRQSINS